MSGLKFTLSDVTSFLPENLSGLKKKYFEACKMFTNFNFVLIVVNLFCAK